MSWVQRLMGLDMYIKVNWAFRPLSRLHTLKWSSMSKSQNLMSIGGPENTSESVSFILALDSERVMVRPMLISGWLAGL